MRQAGCALSLVVLAGAAWGDVVFLAAAKDNTLYQNPAGELSNGAGKHFFAGTTVFQEVRRGLIAFDFSDIPAGAEITGVELRLHMSRTPTTGVEVGMHRLLADWGEGASQAPGEEGGGGPSQPGDATWIHTFFADQFWASQGGEFVAEPSAMSIVGAVGFYSWSGTGLVADVQAWIDGTLPNFGWAIVAEEQFTMTAKRFDSREHPDEALRPVLRVEFIPAPGWSGLAMAWAGMGGLSRRRRARSS